MFWNIPGATYDSDRTQIFSSGGGVQSAAITALIVRGDIPKPDLAIIVDTEREKSTTWEYLNNVTMPALKAVGVEINRVKKSEYATWDLFFSGGQVAIPAFTTKGSSVGKLSTYCSANWKTRVIQRWATKQGVKKAQNWIGFSVDEINRAARQIKNKPGKWGVRFPLLEVGMNRIDCLSLVKEMDWPTPPRSSCWMCPNMHMREWREVQEGPDWEKVVSFEEEIRIKDKDIWLTDQCVPISQADFSEQNESMWGDSGAECESGMCFV